MVRPAGRRLERVAIVSSLLPPDSTGGAEAYVQELARGLAARYEVFVLTASRDAEVPGADVRPLPALPAWDKANALPRKAVWHARDQWRPAVYRALRRELERIRPDVVHSHGLQGLSAAPLSAIRRHGAGHVHTAHDFNLICVEATMTRGGLPCGGRCAKCAPQRRIRGRAAAASIGHFIAPSRYLLDRHLAAGVVRPGASEVIRPGVPDAPARPREARDGSPVVGFIGTLGVHKGVTTLLGAGRRPLVVAGTGPLEERVRAADGVDHRGYVTGAAKDAFFDSIDLLAVPSECEENAPLVLAEAAVRGIPAVVSDRGGLPEAPEAEVFRAGDPRALAEAVNTLTARLPEASRRLIDRRDEFLWDGHVAAVEQVLQRARV